MQTAVKAIYHDHCYVMPLKQGATSLLFPSVSGLNTRIQGGKVVVMTSPDLPPAVPTGEEKQEEEELNEGIAHDHGYYQSTSGSEESQDEKPETSSGKSSIALDLPASTKSGVAIAFGPTSSNMSFPDCQFSTLPAQIFAQDEEESPLVDSGTKLELSPEVLSQHLTQEHTIRFAAKETPEGKKRQRKSSINTKPPPEPVIPTRKGTRQRKPSTKVKEMQEEAEEKEKRGTPKKRKAIISIARPDAATSVLMGTDVNTTTVHKALLFAESLPVTELEQANVHMGKVTDMQETALKKLKRAIIETSPQKATPKHLGIKKRKKEELLIEKVSTKSKDSSESLGDSQSKSEDVTSDTHSVAVPSDTSKTEAVDTVDVPTEASNTQEKTSENKSQESDRDAGQKPGPKPQMKQKPLKGGRPSKDKAEDKAEPQGNKEETDTEQKTSRGPGRQRRSTEGDHQETVMVQKITRGRGRQPKDDSEDVSPDTPQEPEKLVKTPRGRGRPPKNKVGEEPVKEAVTPAKSQEESDQVQKITKGRVGRPPKNKVAEVDKADASSSSAEVEPEKTPRGRGRPPKKQKVEEDAQRKTIASDKPEVIQKPTRGRGRPPKNKPVDDLKKKIESVPVTPRGRGRPRKSVVTEDDSNPQQDIEPSSEKENGKDETENESEVTKLRSKQIRNLSEQASHRGAGDEESQFKNTTGQTKQGADTDYSKGTTDGNLEESKTSADPEPKRRRGRQPKHKPEESDVSANSKKTVAKVAPVSVTESGKTSQGRLRTPIKSNSNAIPGTSASTRCQGKSTKAVEQTIPVKRGRKRKVSEETGDDDAYSKSEELTIRFIPNGDVSKTGNHWGHAIPTDLLLRIFQQVVAVEGSLPFLSRVSKVCRLWYEVGNHPSLWSKVDLSASCVKKYKKSLTSLCRNRLGDCTTALSLRGWESLTDADLEGVVRHCKNLETLNLSGCNKLSSVSVRTISHYCKHLAKIDFSQAWPASGQQDKSAKSLCLLVETLGTGFRSLSLGTTAIVQTESIIDALMMHCPNLEHLDISNCLFGNYLMKLPLEQLQEACPKLRALLLGNSLFQVKEPTNKELAKCPGFVHLETLDISRSSNNVNKFRYITDDVLRRLLRNAFDLKSLNISGCRHVTSEGIDALPIVSLKNLGLAHCRAVTQPSIVDVILKWGHSLQQLDLSGNSIDEQIVLRLTDGCPNLSRLNLSGCRGLPYAMRREQVGEAAIADLRQALSTDA